MQNFNFPVEVVRTNRKKSATIKLDGSKVRINVPKSLSDRKVEELIEKRRAWIETKLQQQALKPQPQKKQYIDGEDFFYLGKSYQLKILMGKNDQVKISKNFLVVTLKDQNTQTKIRSILEGWYKERAKELLTKKTIQLAKVIDVHPRQISIKNYRSRWGSCSSTGNLSYNWRIIQAPINIIDYVIVHELCHLIEHNHSPRYWSHVSKHFPKWKECRDWLKNTNINNEN